MPTWLLITLVVVAVVPGAVVVLAGVAAMFFAPADYDRRRKRLADGRCVQCGHDLRGGMDADPATGACPACGRPPFTSPEPVRVATESGKAVPGEGDARGA